MPLTYLKLNQYDVSASAGVASIEFTNIPQGFTDLILKLSLRSANAGSDGGSAQLNFNSNTSAQYSFRWIRGDGANATSNSSSTTFIRVANNHPTAGNTASTFNNSMIYIPNYSSSTVNKSTSEDNVSENNSTTAYMFLVAGLWSNTNAITSLKLTGEAGNFVLHSSATLYGVTKS